MPKKLPAPPIIQQAPQPEQRVNVISPDDEVGTIDASELASAEQYGFQQATPENLAKLADKETYGNGIVNQLEAGALGFLRGSTLGLSDVALRAAAPDWADAAAKLKEYNPGSSMVGEIGSFVVPSMAAAKVAGAAGRAVGSTGILQKLVSSGAESIGDIATKIVGENLAGKALSTGVKVGAEAAVYQAAHNISENSLQDKELTAESILAGTGQAAILGAGIGAALPVLAAGAQKVAQSTPVRKVVDSATSAFAKFFDPDHSLQLYSGAAGNSKLLRDDIAGTKFKDAVHDLMERGFYKPGKMMFDGESKFVQVEKGGLPSSSEAYQRLVDAKDSVYKHLNNTLSQADAAIANSTELKSALSQFPASAEESILQKISDAAENGRLRDPNAMLDELDRVKQLFAAKGGSLTGLNELKKGLYEGMNYDVAGKAGVKIQKDIIRAVKSSIEAGAEAAGPGLGQKVKDLNTLWGNLETIRKPLDVLTKKGEANVNVLGLRFRDIGIGAIGGGVLGGPAGLGIAVANRALQTDKGLLFRAELGQKLQNLAWAEKLTDDGQKAIASGLNAFVKGNAAGAVSEGLKKYGSPLEYALTGTIDPTKRVKSQQQWFEETRKQLLAIASDTDSFAADQGEQLQSLADHAPGLADSLLSKQLQIHAYLLQAMPKNPTTPLSMQNDTWKPADYQIQDFRRIVQVARAPLTIMDGLRSGTATPKQVQAVQTLYPKIYESILTQVRALVDSPGTHLNYNQQLKLGQLFPGVIPTMRPEFVAALQHPAAKPEEHGPKPGGQVQFSQRRQTQSERSEAR